MTRNFISFPIADPQQVKTQMLNWANRFNICLFLDTHHYHESNFQCLIAAGSLASISASAGSAFEKLAQFSNHHNDWIFGHFGFDLKNETEGLSSSLPDHIGFDDLFFFVPRVILRISGNQLVIGVTDQSHGQVFDEVLSEKNESSKTQPPYQHQPVVNSRFTKQEYIDSIGLLKQHILWGDCYEINFCQEFYAETVITPLDFYYRVSRDNPNPFAAFYKHDSRYALCFSPERYLSMRERKLISQPIKGTAPRDLNDPMNDNRIRNELVSSEKERAENIMVVDLVRNDLSRVCEEGTVKVEELCAVYAFPQVFQMISTISGSMPPQKHWTAAIRETFPMGSMTGAPKKRVMELIEKYERTRRGVFSGSLGYVDPEGNFDFNVVIRTVLYDADSHYLSFQTGSAITFNSNPDAEYEECLLKAAAIKKALAETNTFH